MWYLLCVALGGVSIGVVSKLALASKLGKQLDALCCWWFDVEPNDEEDAPFDATKASPAEIQARLKELGIQALTGFGLQTVATAIKYAGPPEHMTPESIDDARKGLIVCATDNPFSSKKLRG